MEVKPIHIVTASIIAFFVIVAANMVGQYTSNADFREKLQKIDPSKLQLVRKQLVAEEQMIPVESEED